MCCHFNNHIAGGAVGRLLAEGYIGVDIFIFCSAIGLVQSYSRRPAALAFYRKRVVRILPTFLAVTLAVLVFAAILGTKDLHLRDWAMTLSTLGYWTGDAFFEWYTPAILALYALFPLLYQACSIKMGGGILLIVSVLCALVAMTMLSPYHYWLVARIPIFIAGILVAMYLEKVRLSYILCAAMCGVLVMIWSYSYPVDGNYQNVLRNTFFAPLVIFLIVAAARRMPTKVMAAVTAVGGVSYELFLVHFAMIRYDFVSVMPPLLCLVLSFILAFAFAFAIRKLTSYKATIRK